MTSTGAVRFAARHPELDRNGLSCSLLPVFPLITLTQKQAFHTLSSSVCGDSALTKKTFSCNGAGCVSFSQPVDIPQVTKSALRRAKWSPGPMPPIRLHQLRTKDPSSLCFTIHTTSQSAGFSDQTGIFFKTALQLAPPFCDRPLVDLKKDRNLREILVHSNLRSQANSTSGTVPCSTDRCKACPHLCADTSIRGPNGHMSIKKTSRVRATTWYTPSPVSLATSSMWVQVPPGSFFGASGWHPPQAQQPCSPTR